MKSKSKRAEIPLEKLAEEALKEAMWRMQLLNTNEQAIQL